ncbi:hypothetical protein T265_09309 [Opisthorchis viverrini]|uniref:EF-hand domain-containing protein n=1 Tax=Opisthorchis viverrini TaxID=6198 RepID=A0A074Z6H4_OPIVI|nr:hypothetical protein T265_09309 [Opisthorchis viverrini]KER22648.1 hypothetical protein T265_09309 [Opisthorchis viverrini]
MRAGILPGSPRLDRESREAEVGFEPRTFRSVNSRYYLKLEKGCILQFRVFGEKEVEEVFRMMDRNKDGVISQKEFLQFLKKYGHERDDKHLLNLFHMADCNDDKRLSLNELKAILCQKH